MVNVVILGHGMAASHFIVGVERIKLDLVEPYGVPLANHELPIDIKDINVVGSYDVDLDKIGKSLYEVSKNLLGDEIEVPESLKKVYVKKGVHLKSLECLPINAAGLESEMTLKEAVDRLVDEWREMDAEVFINVVTTEYTEPYIIVDKLESVIRGNKIDDISASQFYAYAAYEYAKRVKPIAFINLNPTPLANDPAYVELYEEVDSVILGDDGATGATPLTADLLEHLANRNRYVQFIVQFNIGGNLDFLSLTQPKKNVMKEKTKSSIVEDILGYDAPHYIKPTGYLEPLGDKKFVSIHIGYKTFNGLNDSLYINARINDSPALAGYMVDLARLGKILVDKRLRGTVYEVNAFYMKKPGPKEAKSVARIIAYRRLLEWLSNL